MGHLGGMFVGYLYLKFGKQIFSKVPFIRIKRVKTKTQNEETSTGNIDIILDKLKLEGWDGLTEDEKSKLYQASKEKEEHHSIN